MKKYFFLLTILSVPLFSNASSWSGWTSTCNYTGSIGCRKANGETYISSCSGSFATNKDTYQPSESITISASGSGLSDPGYGTSRCYGAADTTYSSYAGTNIFSIFIDQPDVQRTGSGSVSFAGPSAAGSYSVPVAVRVRFDNAPNGAAFKGGSIPYTIAPSSQCSDSLNNDSAQGADTLDPECHTDCNVNNAISYVPTHDSESVGPNGSCGSTETNMVDIGWDNGLATKTKSVTLQSGQSALSDTIYLSSWDWNAMTAGKCSLKKKNGASWDYVPSVEYFSENTGTFAYTVSGLTAGTHEYQYECKKASWASDPVTKVSANATITVAAYVGTPVVTCSPSPQASPATFNWTASGFTNQGSVVCTVDGTANGVGVASGSFSRSSVGAYAVNCTDGTQSQSASCSVTPGAPSCGDAVCNGAETCSTCASDCGTCTLGAACSPTPTVPTLVTNQNFNVNVSFVNTGSKVWDPSVSAFNNNSLSSFPNWDGVTRPLTIFVSGTPSSGIFNSTFNLTAHSRSGIYPLSFRMSDVNGYFGSTCLVNGDGNIEVRNPECSDGVDNGDPEDTVSDSSDPGCIVNGVYDPNDNDEQDPSLGAALKISASPQLVRQGGSSTIKYEVNGCLTTPGNVPAAWQFRRDGIVLASGTGTSSGERVYPVTNIQAKTNFTVSCGSTTRSAPVSLIKVSEF